mmetsp:Transcript_145944/g.406557  ORF Transcript_145944/g.406557 Transcript_145944/m.406557 type:complete len:149 (-) Transcript_145944:112-558(-)
MAQSAAWRRAAALRQAAGDGDAAALEQALAEGAEVDSVDDEDGFTALMLAAGEGHLACVQRLFDARASLDLAADNGRTALHMAASGGRTEVVAALLALGCRVDLKGTDYRTALNEAQVNLKNEIGGADPGALEVVIQLLQDAMASPSA